MVAGAALDRVVGQVTGEVGRGAEDPVDAHPLGRSTGTSGGAARRASHEPAAADAAERRPSVVEVADEEDRVSRSPLTLDRGALACDGLGSPLAGRPMDVGGVVYVDHGDDAAAGQVLEPYQRH